MRSLLIACGVVLVMPTLSLAQMRIELGVKAGMNISGLGLSSSGKLVGARYNSLLGFHGGGYAKVRFKKFDIQPELMYSRQGQIYSTPYSSYLRSDLHYINLPVLVKYYLGDAFNVYAGPQIGFLMGAKGDLIQIYPDGSLGPTRTNQDLKNYLSSTDFSFVFGLGLDLPKGINVSARYNFGLTNINKFAGGTGYAPSFSTAYAQNQVIQFAVGYRLFKKGK